MERTGEGTGECGIQSVGLMQLSFEKWQLFRYNTGDVFRYPISYKEEAYGKQQRRVGKVVPSEGEPHRRKNRGDRRNYHIYDDGIHSGL